MLYSTSTGGFYDRAIHGDAIPKDAVEITTAQHKALIEGQSKGCKIVIDAKGFPVLEHSPEPTTEERVQQTKSEALTTIDHFHAETVQQLVGNPTQVEKDTWALKLEIANAITSKAPINPAGQSFLQSANITTGAAQAEWATSVLAKSAAYATVVGLAEALRSTARAAVKAATDQASLESALAAHRTAAEEAKASLAKRS